MIPPCDFKVRMFSLYFSCEVITIVDVFSWIYCLTDVDPSKTEFDCSKTNMGYVRVNEGVVMTTVLNSPSICE